MKKFFTLLAIVLANVAVQAQTISPTICNSAGGSANITGVGYVAWSVGEPIVGTISTSSATITQGFLQTWPTNLKDLILTIYLESLYNGVNMNKAQNESGDQFPGSTADKITVELRDATTHSMVYSNADVNLTTSGQAEVSVPGSNYHSYYIAVKHRNSIETWSASPVSFSGNSINFDFSADATYAYGNNLKQLATGVYGIYAGDVNQDGVVDENDITTVASGAAGYTKGYILADVNGDGVVDALDLIMADNNTSVFAAAKRP
jgi:hypothetical protein